MFFKNKRLKKALMHNDVDTAKQCLKSGATIDSLWLNSFLSKKTHNYNLESIQTCIESGIDVETFANDESGTILLVAASIGAAYIVEYLTSKGANPKTYDENGISAIYHATLSNDRDSAKTIKILAENGASINYMNGNIPLIGALLSKNIENIDTLIDLGVNTDIKNINGKTIPKFSNYSFIIEKAIDRNKINIVKMFIENGLNIDTPLSSSYDETILHSAARLGHIKIVEYAISKNATAEIYDHNGTSALQDIASSKNTNASEIIKILVKNGADINYQGDEKKRTPLIRSCIEGTIESISTLLKLGAKINCIDLDLHPAWNHASQEVRKAFPEMQPNKKTASIKDIEEKPWKLCFVESIALTLNSNKIKRELTEIFNFSSQDVTTIILNTERNIESHSKELFSQYPNRKRLNEACLEYNKITDTTLHVNPDDILQIKTKEIDGITTQRAPIKIFNHNR